MYHTFGGNNIFMKHLRWVIIWYLGIRSWRKTTSFIEEEKRKNVKNLRRISKKRQNYLRTLLR